MGETPHLLFLPVSGPTGTGEYARSLTVARGFQARFPDARIRFVLSRHAPYLDDVPFPVEIIDDSPTRCTPQVTQILRRDPPHVALFDCAGRTRQLREARRVGSRTIYTSRHRGQRWKAFRLRWLHLLDRHWIAFPPCVGGPLTRWERLKLRHTGQTRVEFVGPVFAPSRRDRRRRLLQRLELEAGRYLLLTPGGGGHRIDGRFASEVFASAGSVLAPRVSDAVVLIAGVNAPRVPRPDGVRVIPHLCPSEMTDLLHDAGLVVCTGGSTLFQALAYGRACVATPVADDQRHRVTRCARLGVVQPSAPGAEALARTALQLSRDPYRCEQLRAAAAGLGLDNGLSRAVESIESLIPARTSGVRAVS